MAEDIKKCAWCDQPAAFDRLKRQMTTCGSDECVRKQAAERKRRQRARAKEAKEAEERRGDVPEGLDPETAFAAPFGPDFEEVWYEDPLQAEIDAAWLDLKDAIDGLEPHLPDDYSPAPKGKRHSWRAWWLVDHDHESDISPEEFYERLLEQAPEWTKEYAVQS